MSREKIEQLAARWVAREDRGLTSSERSELSGWLEQSVHNRICYLRLRNGWEQTVRLAALQNAPRFSDRPDRRFMRWFLVAAIFLGIVSMGAGSYYYFGHRSVRGEYATQFGERSVLSLPDGTRIQLNTETQVSTNITEKSRTVTLKSGEAYFEVAHDPSRPFVVLAGNRRITDIGTKFAVRRIGDDVRVTVTEGRVRVDVINTPASPGPVFVDGGNIAVARANETLVAAKSEKELSDDLGWRNGMLFFDQDTLADAADEFNRYNRKRVVVEGSARDIRIGGSFRSDNIQVFALLAHNALGLKVRDEGNEIIISR